jgi:hypothetical protein
MAEFKTMASFLADEETLLGLTMCDLSGLAYQ